MITDKTNILILYLICLILLNYFQYISPIICFAQIYVYTIIPPSKM